MVKDGFHQGGHDTHDFKTGSRQTRSHLLGLLYSNNSAPYGRTEPVDELSRDGEPE